MGFAFLRGWEIGFCALCLGVMKQKQYKKMGMGFHFEHHRLGLWHLSWDLKKKKICWEMGLGTLSSFFDNPSTKRKRKVRR